MKKAVFILIALGITSGASAADVGVSINIAQPGFYGRIDLGAVSQPQVIYPRPIAILPGPPRQPIYLRVPPGREQHWDRYCREYNACNQPVYFVREDWYQREYVPHFRNSVGDRRDHDHGHEHDHDHEHEHDRGHDRDRDRDR